LQDYPIDIRLGITRLMWIASWCSRHLVKGGPLAEPRQRGNVGERKKKIILLTPLVESVPPASMLRISLGHYSTHGWRRDRRNIV